MLEDEISLDDLKQHRASLEAKRARLQNTKDGKISHVELNAPFGLIANATRGSETVQSGWGLGNHIELFTPRLGS